MAPRIAGDKVVIGVSGGDRPMRGCFDAYCPRGTASGKSQV